MSKLHMVSILDRSGSMMGTEKEVIGAYNSFVERQKKLVAEKGIKATMTLILFDDQYEEVYFKSPIELVPELTSSVYFIRGMTALNDAIGKTINRFADKKNVIFFIETDGFENTSREFTAEAVKNLVKAKKEAGWDFNFVGADLDKFSVQAMAATYNIDSSKTLAFKKSGAGYATRNATMAAATSNYIDTLVNSAS